jgi:uncharacterized repeat protein (TIGR01451 family)
MKSKLLILFLSAGFLFLNSCDKEETSSVDLTATISASDLTPVIGTNVTFTIVAHNNGPDNATGVDVTNNLPTGYTVVSSTPSVGSMTDRAWVIGNLANGKSETLIIVATVLAQGTHTYAISILGNEADPSSLNGTDEVIVVPIQEYVDVAVSLTVDNSAPVIGSNVTFAVAIKNEGLLEANGVSVTDALPAGYTLVSATPSIGTYSSPTWTVGKFAKGSSATLSVVAKVNSTGSYAYAATVASTETDSNTKNNTATIATVPVPATSSKITYNLNVKPLLIASCTPCHITGGSHPKKFDVYANAKSNINGIINRVSRAKGSSGFMPQGGEKMSDANIALLNQWVTDGLLEK